jgi:hypothetical protein
VNIRNSLELNKRKDRERKELLRMNQNIGKGKQENQSAQLKLRAAQAQEEEEERIQTVATNQAARTALGHDGKYLKWTNQNSLQAKSAVNLPLSSPEKNEHKLLSCKCINSSTCYEPSEIFVQDTPFLSVRNITSKVRFLSIVSFNN